MQAYLLPIMEYDEGKLAVLIGRKKLEGCFITVQGNKKSGSYIWNYSGQWAISGGKALDGEKAASAGLREFKEETGVPMAIKYEDATIETISFQHGLFSCTYVILGHEEADDLKAVINGNITKGQVDDDELESVEWFRIDDARQKLTTRITVDAKYQKKAYQATDWFADMIDGALEAIKKDPRSVF